MGGNGGRTDGKAGGQKGGQTGDGQVRVRTWERWTCRVNTDGTGWMDGQMDGRWDRGKADRCGICQIDGRSGGRTDKQVGGRMGRPTD